MLGFFRAEAALQFDITLLLQIVVLLMVILGYNFARSREYRRHGLMMTSAVILHAVTILLVMVPSFVLNFGILVTEPTMPGVMITWVHAAAGIIALAMGIFLISNWGFRSESECMRRKRMMKPLLGLWVLALVLGISFYVYYYL